MNILNVAAYKFVALEKDFIHETRHVLREKALMHDLKGTIILSAEGIKVELAGEIEKMHSYQNYLEEWPEFQDLIYKESYSDYQPFSRMLVRLKQEIITMGRSEIQPEKKTAPYLTPKAFKQWYQEGRDMVVLDTRNDYEVDLGTFKDAIDLNIETFRAFPDAVDMLPDSTKKKPVVTFCTGGIRCEKAAELMLRKGFSEVYQLEGGILNYFTRCGGDYYEGECFVFDKRVAVDTALQETDTKQCFACRQPVPMAHQTSRTECPHCHEQDQIG